MSADATRGTARRTLVVLIAAVVVVGAAILTYALLRPSGLSPELTAVHDATSEFQTVAAVEAAGYGELLDAEGVACIDHDDQGAMGIHYVHGDRVGDATLDPVRPEAMIYEPTASGSLELVGVEYVVFQDAWNAEHSTPPTLFGEELTAIGADNRYGIPAFYELHAWVWRDNPAGMFADYNPDVTCERAAGGALGHGAGHGAGQVAGQSAADAAGGQPPAFTPRERLGGW